MAIRIPLKEHTMFIKELEHSDIPFVKSLYQIQDIQQYCLIHEKYKDKIDDYVYNILEADCEFGWIIENQYMQPVGMICNWVAPVFRFGYENVLGFWFLYSIHPQYRGRGYATEALKSLISQFHHLDIAYAAMLIEPDNLSSQRVAQKCGFVNQHIRGGRRPDGSIATESLWIKNINNEI